MPRAPRRARGSHRARSGPRRVTEKRVYPAELDFRPTNLPTFVHRNTFFDKNREGQGAFKDGPKSTWRPFRNGLPEPKPYVWDAQKLNNSWAARIAERNLRAAEEEYGIED